VTGPEERDERIDALEADVADMRSRLSRVEQDAAAARILAGGADRDVGEVRHEFREFRDQNNRLLSAMREDLTDLRSRVDEQFARVDERFARVDEQFSRVDQNFLSVHSKIDGVTAGLQVITDLLTRRQGDDGPRR
jgi:chromosome segregation ATPase